MKNWKQIASGTAAAIPEPDLDRISPSLDAIEAAFRPLTKQIPPDVEPALIFRPLEDAD
jgi:hypothetical protein